MSLYHGARHRLIPANYRQPRIVPRAVIAHSAAGMGSLYHWWLNPASRGLESHFWVSFGGLVEQYVDTQVRADANGQANSYAVSIETESSIQATERWSAPQAAAIVSLIVWLCRTHRVPPALMASPTGSGLAWHIQFGAPGPWTGVAKSCPGPARIRQYRAEIVPAVQRIIAGAQPVLPAPPSTSKDWFAMATEAQLRKIVANEVLKAHLQLEAANRKRHTEVLQRIGSIRGWSAATAEKVFGKLTGKGSALERASQLDNGPKK